MISRPGNTVIEPYYDLDTTNSLFQYIPREVKKEFNYHIIYGPYAVG